ncbi:MAG: hypothetical protein GY859_38040, partial [Desulfobacterales bacterium]|nr:hypothetical protein [Desulfobacterales bacterium]
MKKNLPLYLLAIILILLPATNLPLASEAGPEKRMRALLESGRDAIRIIQRKSEAGHDIHAEFTAFKTIIHAIEQENETLLETFRHRTEQLGEIGRTAALDHEAMTERVLPAIQTLLEEANALNTPADLTAASLQIMADLLETLAPTRKRPIHGVLPVRRLNYPGQTPTYQPTTVPAYLGGVDYVAPGDLEGSPEGEITREIAALAQSVGWTPMAIYKWAMNNIKTEYYAGLMKGAG